MNDCRQNIMKRDMKVEDESVKPREILVGVIRLQVSISVSVIQGADIAIAMKQIASDWGL